MIEGTGARLDRERALLLLVLGVAALLRFSGLRQGIPFSVGIDEPEVMERAVRMMKTADFNPRFFDYPSLYIYMETVVSVFRFLVGAMGGRWAALSQATTADFYLWGRMLTAALGTATVALLYAAGRRWGREVALLSAAMLAVMPLHVRESHFTLTDVPATFFVTLTFLLALRAQERGTLGAFVLAGMASGLAAATKYNGVVVMLIPVMAAAGLDGATPARRMRTIAAIAASAFLAFLAGAPYTLLDLPNFLNQFARLASEYRVRPLGAEPAWIVYLKHLRIALGWSGSLLVLTGLGAGIYAILRGPDRLRWAIPVMFAVAYFYFVSHQSLVFARYLLPIVPFLSLVGAWGLMVLVRWTAAGIPVPILRQAAVVVLILVALVPAGTSAFAFNWNASKVWTTEQAYDWLSQRVPAHSKVVIETRVVMLPPQYRTDYVKQLRFKSFDEYAASGTDYLVASSDVFGIFLNDPQSYPSEFADYTALFRQAPEVARFVPSSRHPGPELRILKVQP
jgi:4-amino-4-deoxy-L-arabinose transferase-like glycosyltransferase